jgi:hypothetical protein
MPSKSLSLVFLIALSYTGAVQAQNTGNATVPIQELLALQASAEDKSPPPPTPAAVQRVVIKSRLLRGALKMTAQVHLSVLANRWVQVPLFVRSPDVFNYTRKGGSLGLGETRTPPSFAHSIPTPGKTVQARQQLVTQSPHLTLQYTVDLEGKYYRGTSGNETYQVVEQ